MAEAVQFQKEQREQATPAIPPPPPPPTVSEPAVPATPRRAKKSLIGPQQPKRKRHSFPIDRKAGRRFIELVGAAGAEGITSEDVAKQLGLNSGKAISSPARAARELVREAKGTNFTTYIWKKRNRVKGWMWYSNQSKLKEIGLM